MCCPYNKTIGQRLVFWQRQPNTATVAVTSNADASMAAGDQCAETLDSGLEGGGSCGAPDEGGSSTKEESTVTGTRNRSWLFSMEMNAQVS